MRVFVSHSSSDKAALVQPLIEELRRQEITVWYDTEQLSAGDSLSLGLSNGLASSDAFLLVLSAAYFESRWCAREMGAIITESITKDKPVFVARAGGIDVPAILSDIVRFDIAPDSIVSVAGAVQRGLKPAGSRSTGSGDVATPLLDQIFESERRRSYGANLLPLGHSHGAARPENEGLIIVKPGGTFHPESLKAILTRVLAHGRIRQLRLLDGRSIREKGLFDKLYSKQVALANGHIPLDEDDYAKIEALYKRDEFTTEMGVRFSRDLVVPALLLCQRPDVEAEWLTREWNRGRSTELWHNGDWNGLNKIGYQKSVFPIRSKKFGDPPVQIVLNGYVPGLKALFISDSARVVAMHVSSPRDWSVIRNEVVGGESNPKDCLEGSIRRDAFERRIPLDEAYRASRQSLGLPAVDGQLNVCHASATLLDGMRELADWFGCALEETLVGKLLLLEGMDPQSIRSARIEDVARISRTGRDKSIRMIVNQFLLASTVTDLRAAEGRRRQAHSRIAAEAGFVSQGVTVAGFAEFVENGLRLALGGEELFLDELGEGLPGEARPLLLETVKRIKHLATPADGEDVLAEAFRIAAGDACLLPRIVDAHTMSSLPAEEHPRVFLAYPKLFQAAVVSDLPWEALECARRTRSNLVKSIEALRPDLPADHWTGGPLDHSPPWLAFLQAGVPEMRPNRETVAIVLCGGRSTRTSSSIPKPALPLRGRLLFQHCEEKLRSSLSEPEIVAAVGYRGEVLRRALGEGLIYHDLKETFGVGFRVAAALESLRSYDGLTVVMYCDMPDISKNAIRSVANEVRHGRKCFGIVTAVREELSGCLVEEGGRTRVVQKRLFPHLVRPGLPRDAGVYAFHNTPEFREALGAIRNGNNRREFMFADVVEVLSERGWSIVPVVEEPRRAGTVNTASDLLQLTCEADHSNFDLQTARRRLKESYGVEVPATWSRTTLTQQVRAHVGPVAMFPWWNDRWD